jgi:predicted GNAT family acetyltransferase
MNKKIKYVYDKTAKELIALDGTTRIGEISVIPSGTGIVIIDYTAVVDEYRGRGIGAAMVHAVVELARQMNKKIMPLCPFARSVFLRHPEYNDVKLPSVK